MNKLKLGCTIPVRNDGYGGGDYDLQSRAIYCLNSAINTYDKVFLVDWNSDEDKGPLLWNIQDKINFQGNLHHIVISPEVANMMVNGDKNAQVCSEVNCRNIGIRRLIDQFSCDWVVSTNIDIIAPKRDQLEQTINNLDPNTFYTISRRHTDWETIEKFHDGTRKYQDWSKLRDYLAANSEERHYEEKVVDGDDYSLINCSGDYQLATKHIWNSIRGFEEDLIYTLYSDTNVQKKAVKHGFGLKAIYSPALFHIYHGKGGGGLLDGINKKINDPYRAIVHQEQTQNSDTWGFSNIEIEYETI